MQKKEIRICYRYVLVNETDSPLMVRQADCCEETEVEAESREGLVWSRGEDQNIQVSMAGYEYSCAINTNNLGRLGLQLSPQHKASISSKRNTPQPITVDIQEVSSTIYIVFTKTSIY